MKKLSLSTNDSVFQFCRNYINKPFDRKYVDNVLLEWYPGKVFKTNFNYDSACIGVMPTGHVIPHIDDGRNSAMIIPFNEISVTQNNSTLTFSEPLLLDTTILHSADSIVNGMFLAVDLAMAYEDALAYLDSFDELTLTL